MANQEQNPWRYNPDEAERVLRDLLPKVSDYEIVLHQLLTSIEVAERVAPEAWSLTLFPDRLRLNVAGIEVLTANQDAIRLLLHEPSLELQASLSSHLTDSSYEVPGHNVIFHGSTATLQQHREPILAPHVAFIKTVGTTRSGKPVAGTALRRAHSPGLISLLERHFRRSLAGGTNPLGYSRAGEELYAFDPSEIGDTRKRIEKSIILRQGQGVFRDSLLVAYEAGCAISGYTAEAALEAAHIVPYQGEYTNTVVNYLLLRADLHSLFDFGLLGIDSRTMSVILSPKLNGTEYEALAGTRIRLPANEAHRPSPEALDEHRRQANL